MFQEENRPFCVCCRNFQYFITIGKGLTAGLPPNKYIMCEIDRIIMGKSSKKIRCSERKGNIAVDLISER